MSDTPATSTARTALGALYRADPGLHARAQRNLALKFGLILRDELDRAEMTGRLLSIVEGLRAGRRWDLVAVDLDAAATLARGER